MIRFWNRMILFDDTRLTKKVFNHDYNLCQNNWCEDLKQIMFTIGQSNCYANNITINIIDC